MAVYKYDGDKFTLLETASFEREGIRERDNLQRLLRSQISLLAPETLVIAEEFGDWDEARRRIDLLALDKEANLVVIEIKRDETGGHMELQAIRYAAMVSTMTYDRAVAAHASYLLNIGDSRDASRSILDFLEWDAPREDEFARDVRIVLVSAAFSRELTTAVLWLNERGLDIRCVRLRPCKSDKDLFVDVQQVIPLPEAEEYQVRIREQASERRNARTDMRDFTKYRFEEIVWNKRRLVLAVVKAYLRDHPSASFEQLEEAFPSELQGSSGVFVSIERAKRHFLAEGEILKLSDGRQIAISSQWGTGNLTRFLTRASALGFQIEVATDS